MAALHVKGALVPTQEDICLKFDANPLPCAEDDKVGIAIETLGKLPINAVRHKPENGTCGWYIWCGEEFSEDPDFFKPLHVGHIQKYLPEIEPYLSLPTGYKFLIAGDYEDVWYEPEISSM
ncbi:hypothetical protein [Thalassomonas sp. RHCl1]|uniref:immunity protein Imm33 domain-containing protein n=1 Tax=Thalassomonas sp. RHCl1 TaxID=2995320 RepID=UPI00248BD512|nr:hypothetical protein [Thalassomonas sp. RHCl1]